MNKLIMTVREQYSISKENMQFLKTIVKNDNRVMVKMIAYTSSDRTQAYIAMSAKFFAERSALT